MSNRLAGKTAFVTAAGQGIGRATALAFAQQGDRKSTRLNSSHSQQSRMPSSA